jgi:hypothetical protein
MQTIEREILKHSQNYINEEGDVKLKILLMSIEENCENLIKIKDKFN